MGSSILEVNNLSKHFKGLKAVDNVSFCIPEKKITGLIGPNGAGKTTCFNMISGTYRPTKGNVIYKNKDITDIAAYEHSKLGIARTFQIMKPLQQMTVLDNVISGALYGSENLKNYNNAKEKALEILNFTGLYDVKDSLPKELGTPRKKRLELARSLATNPELLLLDEVMAGLNPTETDEAVELIRKINENGVTIFLIEHVMRAVVRLCETIIVMNHGEKVAEGAPDKVMNNPYVIEIYLGKGGEDE